MELMNDNMLFPEFNEDASFISNTTVRPSAKDSYTEALNHFYNERLAGHIAYGGYNQSPVHCHRYISEIWEAGEFTLEEYVQNGLFGELPEDEYDCFKIKKRFGTEKEYGFSYFNQLKKHYYRDDGIPLLERYLAPIKLAYKNATKNLAKFFKLIIEFIAILILIISMFLYGKYLFGDNYLAHLSTLSSDAVWKLFIYLAAIFVIIPVIIHFVHANKETKGIEAFFYHPFFLTLMMLLSLFSAFFGLGIFNGIKIKIIRLFYIPPVVFYLILYIWDAVNIYIESKKFKYEKIWRKEYLTVFEENQEQVLRYIRFRILWYQNIHDTTFLPLYLLSMQQIYVKYLRFYERCQKTE